MAANVRRAPLSDLTELTLSSVDKKIREGERSVSLCNYMDVYSNAFIRSEYEFMQATATEREIQKCRLRRGDVVITKDSESFDDIGVPALIRDDVENLVCGYHLAILRPLEAAIDSAYLYYVLQAPQVQHQFHSFANGVTRFGLRKNDIGRVEVAVPELSSQRAIGHVLGTLDDRIELNRRMNETLETTADALFKSWFADFSPVRSTLKVNSDPRTTRICKELPRELADSELGNIPNGWSIASLGDVAVQVRQNVRPNEINPEVPYISLQQMPKRSIALSNWSRGEGIESNKFEFQRGDFLFGKLRPYFHKVGVAPTDGICSTDIVVVRPLKDAWKGFVLGHISSERFVNYTSAVSTGTRMPRTNWRDMSRYRLALPPESTASTFNRLTSPLVERIVSNVHESRLLASIRNTLLPKLISGEIRIPDAEKVLESVA